MLCQSVAYKSWIKKSVFYPWLTSLFSILGQDTLVTKRTSLDPLGSNNKWILHQIVRKIWRNFRREVMHEAHPGWANSSTSQVQYHNPVHLWNLSGPLNWNCFLSSNLSFCLSKLGGWWLLFAFSLKQLCHSWWCLQIHERLQPGSVYYNLWRKWSWKNRQVLLFDTESFCVLHQLACYLGVSNYLCLPAADRIEVTTDLSNLFLQRHPRLLCSMWQRCLAKAGKWTE